MTAHARELAARWQRRRPRGDAGGAIVEFVGLAVLLLVPLVYLVVVVGRVQAGAFAVEAAARSAARAYAAAPDEATAGQRAEAAVWLALRDQGFDLPAGGVGAVSDVSCSASPCLQPEGQVRARVRLDVVLPGVPAVVAGVVPTRVVVQGDAVAVVDRFAGRPPQEQP